MPNATVTVALGIFAFAWCLGFRAGHIDFILFVSFLFTLGTNANVVSGGMWALV